MTRIPSITPDTKIIPDTKTLPTLTEIKRTGVNLSSKQTPTGVEVSISIDYKTMCDNATEIFEAAEKPELNPVKTIETSEILAEDWSDRLLKRIETELLEFLQGN